MPKVAQLRSSDGIRCIQLSMDDSNTQCHTAPMQARPHPTLFVIPSISISLIMGIVRSSPSTQVDVQNGYDEVLRFISFSVGGWKAFQEDYVISDTFGKGNHLFVVLDGHAGPEVAQYCSEILPRLIASNQFIQNDSFRQGLEQIVEGLDADIRKNPEKINKIREKHGLPALLPGQQTRAGCALIIVLVTEEDVTICNVGGCQCYGLYKDCLTKAVLFSKNHTKENEEEIGRVSNLKQGFFHQNKLSGMLPYTRSIGDLYFKDQDSKEELLSSSPSFYTLNKGDIKLLVLGSSGMLQSPSKTTLVIKSIIEEECELQDLKQKGIKMIQGLIAKDPSEKEGIQNMTLLVIEFK